MKFLNIARIIPVSLATLTCALPSNAPAPAIRFPTWKHLSTATGELPKLPSGREQTSLMVFDIDGDHRNDIVMAERSSAPSVVWLRNTSSDWTAHVLETERLPIAAGGTFGDVDGDGDLDVVLGSSGQGSHVWWWENPRPAGDPAKPWKRHVVTDAQKGQHHDQLTGDFLGQGRAQVVAWFQGGGELSLYRPPRDARADGAWQIVTVARGIKQAEGLARGDIDGDGKLDIVGGGRWFKHLGGDRFATHVIDVAQTPGRAEVGDLVKGDGPEVVMVIGDGIGRLKWYQCRGDPRQAAAWEGHDLLGFDVKQGHSLQIADLNGDGHLDIFCAEMTQVAKSAPRPDSKAWIFYGDSRGNFTKTEVATGFDFHEAKVADMNGDGRLDIVSKPFIWQTPRLDVWLNEAAPVSANSTK